MRTAAYPRPRPRGRTYGGRAALRFSTYSGVLAQGPGTTPPRDGESAMFRSVGTQRPKCDALGQRDRCEAAQTHKQARLGRAVLSQRSDNNRGIALKDQPATTGPPRTARPTRRRNNRTEFFAIDVRPPRVPLEISPGRYPVRVRIDGRRECRTQRASHCPWIGPLAHCATRPRNFPAEIRRRYAVRVHYAEARCRSVGLQQHRSHRTVQLRANQRQQRERALQFTQNGGPQTSRACSKFADERVHR